MGDVTGEPAHLEHDSLGDYDALILARQLGKPAGFANTGNQPTEIPEGGCQLCPGREHDMGPLEAQLGEPWKVRATQNRWPVGPGHLVIVLTSRHVGMYDLTEDEWRDAIDLLGTLAAQKRSVIFANHGREAGASQPHAHAQLMQASGQVGDGFRCEGETCVLCAYHRRVGDDSTVFTTEGWRCVSPAAPQISNELRLIADTHRDGWEPAMAHGLTRTIELSAKALGKVPANIVFHLDPGSHAHVHWLPRINPVSVFHLGWGTPCVTDPGDYAEILRQLDSEENTPTA